MTHHIYIGNDINQTLAALTSKLLLFIIRELGSKSIETPIITSDEGVRYRTAQREKIRIS